ncbi:type II toxin-antitoxin system VapC family toxin [Thiocystis violacea]|uniref:type II toxin-antitoxin system VapC family toxin n=1 Tax=Thiocystis violacea TaxID=13725 RepID=UPI001905086A|nr:type II toxin-antitoxin system VapC family toxin [Thiocystis violacea]MBK1725156.1 hypothetical protein [Thiocystis violacea]
MKRRVYLETSVISYLTARPSKTIIGAAHQQITLAWWDKRADYDLFMSELVLRECAAGDPDAARKRLEIIENIPLLVATEESYQLADNLLKKGIIPAKAAEDSLHIAIATTHSVDYLLTWNCKHIANPELQRKIMDYLIEQGQFLPFICTPEELLGEEDGN